jgi:hypothetical protein
VGSGKTVVAACAILMALERIQRGSDGPDGDSGGTTLNLPALAGAFGFEDRTQTGARKTRSTPEGQFELGARSSAGPVLFIGTHALLTAAFTMPNLPGVDRLDSTSSASPSANSSCARGAIRICSS